MYFESPTYFFPQPVIKSRQESSWLTASYHKEIEQHKDTKDEEIQTSLDLEDKVRLQKSLEILEVTDVEISKDIEVRFEKAIELEVNENFDAKDLFEPLNAAVAEQIEQLIAKLNDCVEKN
ncbi:uncharacterized protein LOC110996159 [Pieris rapae]|uniref:uncharacterized protein LOC110996159 n=1 Tax=Pieris rapae TaxID=64459 RepID=UPI001E27DB4A|nr:uncharacterized protein LOC110996159 [Pieris rapae]